MSGFDYDSIMQNAAQQHINNAQTKKRPKTQEYASTQKNTQTDTRAQTGGTGGGDDVDTTAPPVRRGDNKQDGPTKEELEAIKGSLDSWKATGGVTVNMNDTFDKYIIQL